jgi:hypothetical protein
MPTAAPVNSKPLATPLDPSLKIVFVLGAGFSRPLGGLLLPHLLAYTPQPVLNDLFPVPASPSPRERTHPLTGFMFKARNFYQGGKQWGFGPTPRTFSTK